MELIIDRLTKQYKNIIAVDRVSLKLKHGVYGLLGANGAGKTTLMRMMCGLLKPTSGAVKWNGIDVSAEEYRDALGYMPQDFGYYPEFSAAEFLLYMASLKGLTKQRAKEKTAELLELVSLSDSAKKKIKTFSGGMKQRLGIAGALLGAPPVVVLDEPINGLDPQGILDIRNVIKDVHAQTGTTFIISSHILSELDLVATRFGFIDQGVLLQEITHKDLHQRTQKTLVVETDDLPKTRSVLQSLGIEDAVEEDGRLTLASHLDRSHEIARALVNAGLALYDLHRRETTLEAYFMRLVGGGQDA